MEEQYAVIVAGPDDDTLARGREYRPELQREYRTFFIGSWTEASKVSDLWYENMQRSGSGGFTYVVRAATAEALKGVDAEHATFGGYYWSSDDGLRSEPAPDAAPDNLVVDGVHFENFAIALRDAKTFYMESAFPWQESFAQAVALVADPPTGVEYFIVPITCAHEIGDYGAMAEYDVCYTEGNEFEHWQWVDGKVVVAKHQLQS